MAANGRQKLFVQTTKKTCAHKKENHHQLPEERDQKQKQKEEQRQQLQKRNKSNLNLASGIAECWTVLSCPSEQISFHCRARNALVITF